MKQDLPKKIRYEYKEDKDVRLNYTHGVWGGINPQGEIELNFYSENDKAPLFSERMIDADGSFGPETIPYEDEAHTVVRHIHSKILVNYPTAHALLEWLSEKLEVLDTEREQLSFHLDSLDKSNREQ